MSSVRVVVPADRDVFVDDGGSPYETAEILLDAAEAAGLPARVVRVAPEPGGFYVPASLVADNAGGGGEPQVLDNEFTTAVDGLTVTATDTSLPTEGAVVNSFGWNFGDGEVESHTDPTATYTYAEAGTYTITSTVRDSYGYVDTQAYDVTVA